jgi:hypothetical protein
VQLTKEICANVGYSSIEGLQLQYLLRKKKKMMMTMMMMMMGWLLQ